MKNHAEFYECQKCGNFVNEEDIINKVDEDTGYAYSVCPKCKKEAKFAYKRECELCGEITKKRICNQCYFKNLNKKVAFEAGKAETEKVEINGFAIAFLEDKGIDINTFLFNNISPRVSFLEKYLDREDMAKYGKK